MRKATKKGAADLSDGLQQAANEIERLERERDQWRDTAAFHLRNEEFYRNLVRQIGELFGEAARTSDDGSVQDSVLALKVPELVEACQREQRALREKVTETARQLRLANEDWAADELSEALASLVPGPAPTYWSDRA
jgi:hypothetical protein